MNPRQLIALQRPSFPLPTWAEIEASICALNGADRPLFTLAPLEGLAEGHLSVQGREGAYAITAYLPGRGRFRYLERDVDCDNEVEMYNDGGLWDYVASHYVCTNVKRALGVVRYFWEYGELHPSVMWEKA